MRELRERVKGVAERFLGLSFNYAWKNSAWVSLNTVIETITSFFTSIAFANLIPPSVYGSYRYIFSVYGFFGFLDIKWINSLVTQEIAAGRYGTFFWAIKKKLYWGWISVLVYLAISVFYYVKKDYFLAGSFAIIAITGFLTNIFSTYASFLEGKKLFKKKSLYDSFQTIIQRLVVIGILFLTPNLIFIVIVTQLMSLAASAYLYFKTIKEFLNLHQQNPSVAADAKRLSYHLHPLNIFATIANNIDSLLLFNLFGPAALASYAIAKTFPSLIQKYIGNISFIYFPKLASLSLKQMKEIFYFRLAQTIAVGALISGIYIMVSPLLFDAFYPKYPEAKLYTQLIGLSPLLLIPLRYFAYIFQTQKLIASIYVTSLVPLTVRLTLYIVLGYIMGIIGVIAAALISHLVSFITCLIMWHREIKKRLL